MKVLDDYRRRLDEEGSVTLILRIHPGASATRLRSVMDDGTLKIDIAAAPEDGRANAELVRFLADAFGVQKKEIEIVSGEASRRKTVRIRRG